jgi:hypothetical protein
MVRSWVNVATRVLSFSRAFLISAKVSETSSARAEGRERGAAASVRLAIRKDLLWMSMQSSSVVR